MGRSRAARSAAMASASPHFNGSTWTLVLSFNSRLNWRGVCVRMCQFNEEKVNLGVGEPDSGGGSHIPLPKEKQQLQKPIPATAVNFSQIFYKKLWSQGRNS